MTPRAWAGLGAGEDLLAEKCTLDPPPNGPHTPCADKADCRAELAAPFLVASVLYLALDEETVS